MKAGFERTRPESATLVIPKVGIATHLLLWVLVVKAFTNRASC